ncbi:hypothetical protein DH2020_040873 [Rehmannia glutinosa]|uniref:Uncharacterized protein n=1 Tax=Rehmannia glutinosa TaxID=99300 RepID=A0ABR0URS8_REHGL
MASLTGILSSTAILPCKKSRFYQSLQVRAQSYRDEGRSNNIVDSNLHVLRERIEQIKNKERLERCCVSEPGWNYASLELSYEAKREKELLQFLQIVHIAGGTLGLTILSCTFCLCVMSLLVH